MEHDRDCHLRVCGELCSHKCDDCTCKVSPTISRAVVLQATEKMRKGEPNSLSRHLIEHHDCSVCHDIKVHNAALDAVIAFINEN